MTIGSGGREFTPSPHVSGTQARETQTDVAPPEGVVSGEGAQAAPPVLRYESPADSGGVCRSAGAPREEARGPEGQILFGAEAIEAQRRLILLLGVQHRSIRVFGSNMPRVRHAEIRKTIERASDRLRQIRDSTPTAPSRDARLAVTLADHEWLMGGDHPSAPTAEQAWALADALRSLWLDLAPHEDLYPYMVKHPLRGRPDTDDPDNPILEMRRWLIFDHQERRELGSHKRARAALRAHYLYRVGVVLWLLVAMALLVGSFLGHHAGDLVLTALAGAIGGTLSGARALRESSDIKRTRVFQAWWWVQPVVGAAVGLFTYALLTSGVLTLPGASLGEEVAHTSGLVVYSFAAGFSEPFILGILEKITGAADVAANSAANPPSNEEAVSRAGSSTS
jgi:hypothetical protein